MLDVVQVCSQMRLHDHTFGVNILIQTYDDVREEMYDCVDGALGIQSTKIWYVNIAK